MSEQNSIEPGENIDPLIKRLYEQKEPEQLTYAQIAIRVGHSVSYVIVRLQKMEKWGEIPKGSRRRHRD